MLDFAPPRPLQLRVWRGRGLAISAVAAACVLTLNAPLTAAPKPPPPQAVAITYVFGSPASILPGKAELATHWITPLGDRTDFGDGKKDIQTRNSLVVYELDPHAKTATTESVTDNSLVDPDPDAVWRNVVGKIAISHRSFLGYPCLVRKGLIKVGATGQTSSLESWVATVAGRRIALKMRTDFDSTFMFVEALHVQTYPKAPPGLLDLPVGYTVVAQK